MKTVRNFYTVAAPLVILLAVSSIATAQIPISVTYEVLKPSDGQSFTPSSYDMSLATGKFSNSSATTVYEVKTVLRIRKSNGLSGTWPIFDSEEATKFIGSNQSGLLVAVVRDRAETLTAKGLSQMPTGVYSVEMQCYWRTINPNGAWTLVREIDNSTTPPSLKVEPRHTFVISNPPGGGPPIDN